VSDIDQNVETLLDVRKVGANYEEHRQEAGAFDIPVDLEHFKKFPVVDPPGTYTKVGHDTRGEIEIDPNIDLPDYSGPFKQDLRLSDFSKGALVNVLGMVDEYFVVCIEAWAAEAAQHYGRDVMSEIQSEAWQNIVLPQLRRIIDEWMKLPDNEADAVVAEVEREVAARREDGGVVTINPFKADPKYLEYPKERLVALAMGSHEYLLTVIEAWAGDIVMRYGLDAMFDFQWALWSEKVLPAVKDLKARWMDISGDTVEAFLKDVQIDATSFPGKAFDMTFEMPEKDVGIFTFNKCVSVDQWEALGRPDIAEKASHVTCPASIIETAKMYNPNMKVAILAIPPRTSKDDVCCKWRLSMRDESDPEYVRPDSGDDRS
jgi:hypothetical protein